MKNDLISNRTAKSFIYIIGISLLIVLLILIFRDETQKRISEASSTYKLNKKSTLKDSIEILNGEKNVLIDKVDMLHEQINKLENKIPDTIFIEKLVTDSINFLESEVSNLKNRLFASNREIRQLRTKVNSLNKKTRDLYSEIINLENQPPEKIYLTDTVFFNKEESEENNDIYENSEDKKTTINYRGNRNNKSYYTVREDKESTYKNRPSSTVISSYSRPDKIYYQPSNYNKGKVVFYNLNKDNTKIFLGRTLIKRFTSYYEDYSDDSYKKAFCRVNEDNGALKIVYWEAGTYNVTLKSKKYVSRNISVSVRSNECIAIPLK